MTFVLFNTGGVYCWFLQKVEGQSSIFFNGFQIYFWKVKYNKGYDQWLNLSSATEISICGFMSLLTSFNKKLEVELFQIYFWKYCSVTYPTGVHLQQCCFSFLFDVVF